MYNELYALYYFLPSWTKLTPRKVLGYKLKGDIVDKYIRKLFNYKLFNITQNKNICRCSVFYSIRIGNMKIKCIQSRNFINLKSANLDEYNKCLQFVLKK